MYRPLVWCKVMVKSVLIIVLVLVLVFLVSISFGEKRQLYYSSVGCWITSVIKF